jgi:hypothetical protein
LRMINNYIFVQRMHSVFKTMSSLEGFQWADFR